MQPPCYGTILVAGSLRSSNRPEFPPVAESSFPHQLERETATAVKEREVEIWRLLDPAGTAVSQAQGPTYPCLIELVRSGPHGGSSGRRDELVDFEGSAD